MKEIGSEFHDMGCGDGKGIRFPRSGTLTFSGRAAIEAVLNDIPQAKNALLPSYCCDSMIEPFRRAGIRVDFFDVNYDGDRLSVNLDSCRCADILLWCNYFGFSAPMPSFDGIVIEDITHSLLSSAPSHERSDYLVASVRKWLPVYCGGFCSLQVDLAAPPADFVQKKRAAMQLKTAYLSDGDESKKETYLSMFKESNAWLAENYSGLGADSETKESVLSADIEKIKAIRRRNARILYSALDGKVDLLFTEEQMDCPLFVPIVLKKDRDRVRRALAEKAIYCPIHWPHPSENCVSNLYDWELSLVCDQRYTEEDMYRIVSVLSETLKK